jgi:nucleosome assembly protein 1-like 1
MLCIEKKIRLPKAVKRRLKALKRIQAEVNKVESKFYEEVHELEQKYAAQYEPFFHQVSVDCLMCECLM